MPSRLNMLHERVHFHEVNVTPYPLFDPYPPYTLALATKMAEVAAYEKLDVLHVHYAIPHAISAYLAQADPAVDTLEGHHHAARHRHHARRPRLQLPADHEVRHRGLGRRHGGVGVAEEKRPPRTSTRRRRSTSSRTSSIRRASTAAAAPSATCSARAARSCVCHVSNFRPVKRVMDVMESFEKIVEPA